MELYLVDLSAQLDKPVEPYLPWFTTERQAAILRYRVPSDRNRTVWAELLARWLIAGRMGGDAREIAIARDERGKPYWAGGLHFSLSHSGPWVACSLGEAPSGVDVETNRKVSLDVARHFFRPEEYEALRGLSLREPEGWRRAFLRYWTLKESYLKFLGTGLSGGLRDVDCAALLSPGGGPPRDGQVRCAAGGRNFDLPGGAAAGVVCALSRAGGDAPVETLPERVSYLSLRAEPGRDIFNFIPLERNLEYNEENLKE